MNHKAKWLFLVVVLAICISTCKRNDKEAKQLEEKKATTTLEVSLVLALHFDYQKAMEVSGSSIPVKPNTWDISIEFTNKGIKELSVIPIFLINETCRTQSKKLENSMAICPVKFKESLIAELTFPVRVVPEDTGATVSEGVFIPITQLYEPLEAKIGGYATWVDFKASLNIGGKTALWKELKLPPEAKVHCEWESWYTWAFREDIRKSTQYSLYHIGPVITDMSQSEKTVFIIISRMEPSKAGDWRHWVQKSIELKQLTPSTAEPALSEPPYSSDINSFLKAVLKIIDSE